MRSGLAAAASAIGGIGIRAGIAVGSPVAAAIAGLIGIRPRVVVGAAPNMVAAAAMACTVGMRATVGIGHLGLRLAGHHHKCAAADDGPAGYARQKRTAAQLSITLHLQILPFPRWQNRSRVERPSQQT